MDEMTWNRHDDHTAWRARLEERVLAPLRSTGWRYYAWLLFLLGVLSWAVYAYGLQLRYGLIVTNLRDRISWGLYIASFVFFIGISHAGTLLSAILRVTRAHWQMPITRMAEFITGVALMVAALFPWIDMGRPERILNMVLFGRWQSPLIWDITAILTYLTGSLIYLYLPLIPDIAILRDRGTKPKWLYEFLAWGWQGTEKQHKVLERAINILMVMVIPIAVSVHTVISYIFAMTVQPGWHSTIFGPYFVCGAIFSGIAALLIVMIAFRKVYRLERYLKEIHFNYLAILLLIMSFLWFYFTFSEYLTTYYGSEPDEMRVFWYKFTGGIAPLYWLMLICNFIIPLILLSNRKTRKIKGILVASISVVIGMWLERLIIVVPSLANPRLPYPTGIYIPTLTEWSLFAGGVAVFILGYLLFAKFFPVISVWEIREGRATSIREVAHRLRSYLPDEHPEEELARSLK